MFRQLLCRSKTNQQIIRSKLYDESSFYRAFEKDLKRAKKKVVIESPFMTERRSYQLVRIFQKLKKRGVKVIVYTRSPYHHPPRLRYQAIESIWILRDAGVKVYECRDYRHRKVAIIDNQVLWEGSLNILSQSKSRELMRRIHSPMLSKQMLHIIQR